MGKAKKMMRKETVLENLLFSRANIIKNAKNKYSKLIDILNKIDVVSKEELREDVHKIL